MAISGSIASSGGKEPNAPTIGTATAGAGSASITFTAATYLGKDNVASYVATSSPGGITGAASGSPATVTGLTAGTAYTFTIVTRANSAGIFINGPASAASNSVTPTGAALKRCTSFQISIGCCTATNQCGTLGAGVSCTTATTPDPFSPFNCE